MGYSGIMGLPPAFFKKKVGSFHRFIRISTMNMWPFWGWYTILGHAHVENLCYIVGTPIGPWTCPCSFFLVFERDSSAFLLGQIGWP